VHLPAAGADYAGHRRHQLPAPAEDVMVGWPWPGRGDLRRDALVEGRLHVHRGDAQAGELAGPHDEVGQDGGVEGLELWPLEEVLHHLLGAPVLHGLDLVEGQPHLGLEPQRRQAAGTLGAAEHSQQVHHLVVEAVVTIQPVALGGEQLLEALAAPVGAGVRGGLPEGEIREGHAAVIALQADAVGQAKLSQDFAGRLVRGEAFQDQRPQVPAEAALAQRGSDAADLGELLVDGHLMAGTHQVGRRRQASHAGANDDCLHVSSCGQNRTQINSDFRR